MSYHDREISKHDGCPVELYRFDYRGSLFLYTSGDTPVTRPEGTYRPQAISRTEIDLSSESRSGGTDIKLLRGTDVATIFYTGTPAESVGIRILRKHRGEEEMRRIFTGQVVSHKEDGSVMALRCASAYQSLQRKVPRICVTSNCNHPCYSKYCGVDAEAYCTLAKLEAASGNTLAAAVIAAKPAGWFISGFAAARGHFRMITDHSGSRIELMAPIPGLQAGDTAELYAGCDGTYATCRDRFRNTDQFLGWDKVPWQNPFQSQSGVMS